MLDFLWVMVVISSVSNSVLGFAPNNISGTSNAVMDAISEMKSTMNKNQERTMDILNELRANIQELEKANSAASFKMQPNPSPSPVSSVPPNPAQGTPVHSTATQSAVSFPEMKPDALGFSEPSRSESPLRQQTHSPKAEPKLFSLQPDQPLENFKQGQIQSQQPQQNRPTPTSEPRGLVALPPDQPFQSCGQQLEARRRERHESSNASVPPSSRLIGVPPDQPFHSLYQQSRNPPPSKAIGQKVNVVGMMPDQPFGHLNTRQPKPRQNQSQEPNPINTKNKPSIVACKPDQLL